MNELLVRAGQELTARLWNAFWRERRRSRLFAGPGVLIKDTSDGQIISFRGGAGAFIPAFKASIAGRSVTFRLGLVGGEEPLIEDIPITGTKDKPVPKLKLQDNEEFFDSTGRSWLALRVKVDAETGAMIKPDENGKGKLELTIVQRKTCPSTDPDDDTIGYHRLAVLRRPAASKTGLGTLKQIAMHDYQHRTARQNGKWVHFFDPA